MELHTGRPDRSRPRPARPRPTRTLFGTVVAGFAGLLVAIAPSTHAHAAPPPADVEKQIDAAWQKIEPIIEQHNKVSAQLADNKAKVAKLEEQIRPLKLQLDLAMTRVSAISVQAYIGGKASTLNAVLAGGSPGTLTDRLSLLDAIATDEQAKVADVTKLKAQFDAQKKPLDDLVAQLSAQEADLAAQTKDINAQIAQLNQMRLAAYGSGGGTGSLRPVACPQTYDGSRGAKAAQVACQQIGKSYVWATEGPGTFDCSGLTLYSWKQVGVTLRHYTGWQYSDTTRVSRANLMVGDLVFFYSGLSHVGIYEGNGWMTHAPAPGDVVRMARIDDYPIAGYGRPG